MAGPDPSLVTAATLAATALVSVVALRDGPGPATPLARIGHGIATIFGAWCLTAVVVKLSLGAPRFPLVLSLAALGLGWRGIRGARRAREDLTRRYQETRRALASERRLNARLARETDFLAELRRDHLRGAARTERAVARLDAAVARLDDMVQACPELTSL